MRKFQSARLWVGQHEKVFVALSLVFASLTFGLIVASYMTRSVVLVFDEMIYRGTMRYYANHGLFNFEALRTDPYSRGFARLYPFLYSPLFAHYEAYSAIRFGKLLNCLFFASTSLPTYLITRSLSIPRWRACAASLLAIMVPWVGMTGHLMPESLCYPLFIWAVFCIFQSFHRPAWYWDIAVAICILLAMTARIQFLGLLPPYLLLVCLRESRLFFQWRAQRNSGNWIYFFGGFLKRAPLAGVAIVALVYLAVSGQAVDLFDKFVGAWYNQFADRRVAPVDMVLAGGFELLAIAIGTGFIVIVISVSWYVNVFINKTKRIERDFATVVLIVTAVLFGFTLSAQGAYLGAVSEERYFFYVVPLLWVGVFASLQNTESLRRDISGLIAVLVIFCAAYVEIRVPMNGNTIFLAPASSHVNYYVGKLLEEVAFWFHLTSPILSNNDALALGSGLLLFFLLFLWHRASLIWKWTAILFAACMQLALVSAVFLSFSGKTKGMQGFTEPVSRLKLHSWIDKKTKKNSSVLWVNNDTVISGFDRDFDQMFQLYWNSNIREMLHVPASSKNSLFYLPFYDVAEYKGRMNPNSGSLVFQQPTPLKSTFAVQAAGSPLFQLNGKRVAADPSGRLEIIQIHHPVSVAWSTTGLDSEGFVLSSRSVNLSFFAPKPQQQYALRFVLQNPGTEELRADLKLGKEEKSRKLLPKTTESIVFQVCHSVTGKAATIVPGQVSVPLSTSGTTPSKLKLVSVDIFPVKARKIDCMSQKSAGKI